MRPFFGSVVASRPRRQSSPLSPACKGSNCLGDLQAGERGEGLAVRSRNEPVVQTQAGNVLEVGGVVGDKREVMDERHGGDHEVGKRSKWRCHRRTE
jgi:hypothetical protein